MIVVDSTSGTSHSQAQVNGYTTEYDRSGWFDNPYYTAAIPNLQTPVGPTHDRVREIAALNYHGIGFSTTHQQFLRTFPHATPAAPTDSSGVISYAIDDIDGECDAVWFQFVGDEFLCLGFTYHVDRVRKYGGVSVLLDEARQRFGPPKNEDEALTVWRFPTIDRSVRAGWDGTNWCLLVTRDSVQEKANHRKPQLETQHIAQQDDTGATPPDSDVSGGTNAHSIASQTVDKKTPVPAPKKKVAQEPPTSVTEVTKPNRVYQGPAMRSRSSGTTPHIHASVLAGIRKRVARDHPDDYSTQLYVIKQQIEAYFELRGSWCPRYVPLPVYKRIRGTAARAHPDDYSTQLYVIREQLDAYEQLKKMKTPTGVAGSHFFRLKAKANQRQPSDYSTQLYLLNRQIDEYLRYRQSGKEGESIARYLLKNM